MCLCDMGEKEPSASLMKVSWKFLGNPPPPPNFKKWALFQFPTPLLNYKIKMFKNCSHGNLHVRNVVEICSPIHADTFYCSF